MDDRRFNRERRNNKLFKFEEYWTNHEECAEIISRNGDWSVDPFSLSSLGCNLTRCSDALSKWGKGLNSQRNIRIWEWKKALKQAYSNIPHIDFNIIHGLEFELDKLLEEEEIY